MIIVTRNETDYGPYDEQVVARYIEEGKLLRNDKARDSLTGEKGTIETFLTRKGIRPKVKSSGSLMAQLSRIGMQFIFPREEIQQHRFLDDKRLLILALVGLSLSVIMLLPIRGYLAFYVISLYFSTIWGLFFYYCFRTRQVNLKTTIGTFFLTQLGVFIIFSGLNNLNFFYAFTEVRFPLNIIGFILGVGLTEEFAKMLPLLYILKKSKEPMLAQTMVFYGLMAGIAFGVYEGVDYQIRINSQADYTTAFVLNIARLTSLPFLHAMWCGICGYFVGMSNLYPRYRKSLLFLALAIPATLHGLYDSLASVAYILSVMVAFASVFILMTYLRKSGNLRQRLK